MSLKFWFLGLGPRRPLVRDLEAEDLFESFLVAAVASILGIRAFLELTGFPQLGNGGFHIAHVLWGGLLMLAALVIALGFLNRPVKRLAAIVGGLGFGAFVDELGKFITSDNDYFFEPTVALIYVLFIALYLATRIITRTRAVNQREAVTNALELVKEAIDNDFDPEEQRRAAALLEPFATSDPVATRLRELVRQLETVPRPPLSRFARLRRRARALFVGIVRHRWFPVVLVGFFSVQSVITLVAVSARLLGIQLDDPGAELTFTDWGELVGSTLSALLIVIGVLRLPQSRERAYEFFRRSVLVSIFLTRVFLFSSEQLSAVLGLGFDIVLLMMLRTISLLERPEPSEK